MSRKPLFFFFLAVHALTLTIVPKLGATVQWASKVVSFSVQRGAPQYSADQILGKPNKYPAYGDSPCAWSPFLRAGVPEQEERIRVAFARPMRVAQIAIVETLNPGAVESVICYDGKGRANRVHFSAPSPARPVSRIWRVFIARTDYEVASVELILKCALVPGENQIDAIAISDSNTPIEHRINALTNARVGPKENLGTTVNTTAEEVLPIISPDGKTLYFDRQTSTPSNPRKDNIWYSEFRGGRWTASKQMPAPLANEHGAFVASITPDANTLLIGGRYEENGSFIFGPWLSHREKRGWSVPKRLRIDSFYTQHSFIEFCLSHDGNTMILSLQRPDSYGGKDLYVSYLRADSTWTAPKNLGAGINSAGDEGTQYFASDNRTLYYSTNGFSGYGSYDMFLTRRVGEGWAEWSEPLNLGPDLNTPGWDAYFTVPASGEYAYFVSNANTFGRGDIFRVALPTELAPLPVVLISGRVLDAKSDKPLMAAIKYEYLSNGKEAGTANSDPATGEYKIVLPAGSRYGYRAEVAGYASVNENLDLRGLQKYEEISRDLKLVPFAVGEVVRLNNIFFAFGKSDLEPESFPELRRLAQLMRSQPRMELQIVGHTDSIGEAQANLQLSRSRAASVRAFLTQEGIAATRLKAEGFGETRPLASNDSEEGRQQNRRVEFIILRD